MLSCSGWKLCFRKKGICSVWEDCGEWLEA